MDEIKALFSKLKSKEKNAILFDRISNFKYSDAAERIASYPDYVIDQFILSYKEGNMVDFISAVRKQYTRKAPLRFYSGIFRIFTPDSEPGIELETRKGQEQMTKDIEYAIENNALFIGEAPPGTGKSLAYLMPVVRNIKNKKRAVISTNTKNLQMQIFRSDARIACNLTGIQFSACVIKGIANYLCLFKFNENKDSLTPLMRLALEGFHILSESGDLSELKFFDNADMNQIVSDSEFCMDRDCPFVAKCYFMKIRKQAKSSDIIFTNHYLTLIDNSRNNIYFDEYDISVFDEAHNMENVVSELFAYQFNFRYFENMMNYFRKRLLNTLSHIRSGKTADLLSEFINPLILQINIVLEKTEMLRLNLKDKLIFDNGARQELQSRFFRDHEDEVKQIAGALYSINNKTQTIMAEMESGGSDKERFHLIRYLNEKINSFYEAFVVVTDADNEEYAFYYKTDRSKNIVLSGVPVETGELFSDTMLKDSENPALFISATLGINNDFSLFKKQTGIHHEDRMLIEDTYQSGFDWDRQMSVKCITGMGNPNDEEFLKKTVQFIKYMRNHKKRTLVLTTSYDQIAYIRKHLRGKDIFFQKKNGNYDLLLDKYKNFQESVLIGTSRFWEGVDLPGDLLEVIIMLKMPFAVPSDPVIKKRNERIAREGKNPFMEYTLPTAVLRMKQGIGRLIRKKTDRGIVYLLDERIVKKRYGRFIRNALFVQPEITSYSQIISGGNDEDIFSQTR
ncbi:MAG: ATP-dependent DNA helicase [bacterium]